MIATARLASFFNLGGPDLIAIFFILAFWGVVIGGIVLLVRFLARRETSGHPTATPEERLHKLDSMRKAGSITDSEYQEQRRRILSEV